MDDVLAVGTALVDILVGQVNQIPDPGDLKLVTQFGVATGGVASTFARDCARLGLATGLVASVGNDPLGELLIRELKSDGVRLRQIRHDERLATGGSVVLINSNGERSFLHLPGASIQIASPELVDVTKCRHLHLGGTPLLPEYDGPRGEALFRRARLHGVTTSFDTIMNESGWEQTRRLLPFTDIAMPSYEEAFLLTGYRDPADQAHFLLQAGARIAVVKLGSEGAWIADADRAFMAIPSEEIKAIDTTGAGEAFCAGFVYGLLFDWNLEKTAAFATACGSLATQAVGGPTAIESLEKVLKWLDRYPVTLRQI
ncbi:carbohydrate kinase family protein [Cohnella nanjingensis]|uniref:Carbohydrate kinase family protein n=1 Tax=Cohnella nanjingensis TaxID=1387779 RepID=A0A7X0RNI9_9BACL|nr:carbohydrate kinase family protein [Cohnella nanjingensis]MBB6670803.1 carbohydrate kinase family protein [Cohnella nanjingensis]